MLTQQTPLAAQNKCLRVGVIGVGNIGSAHAACIYGGKVAGMRLSGLCDVASAAADLAAQRYPDVPFFQDADALLQSDIDAVIVAVPHPLHGEIAIRAFAAGKHVLVEKPLDITLSKARQLACAAEESGKVFGIMLNQRTGNLFRKAKQIVESGELGQLKRSVWIITNWYRTQHYYDSGDWRATWKYEGGGVLMNQAPHQLDLWQWICGMPVSVTAFCDEGKYHDIEVEDNATVIAKFENGADGIFITSTGEYPGTNRLELSGTKGKLVLENGMLKWWQLEQDERRVCAEAEESFSKIAHTYQEFAQEKISGHQAILQNFANAVNFGEELLAPGHEGLNQLTIQNAAYLSAWKGSVPVQLPFDEAEYDALLRQKQAASQAGQKSAVHRHSKDYSDRWQINW